MEWAQAVAIIASNLVIMLTFFGVAISLHLDTRKEIKAMGDEMKDFHGRLCAIEERTKK